MVRRAAVASTPTIDPAEIEQARQRVLAEPKFKSLVAAASQIKIDHQQPASQQRRVSQLDWQREAWRHYDICGELRFAANRHAGAVSQVEIYVADVDGTGTPGDRTKDPKALAIGAKMLGTPAEREQRLRMLALQFFTAGESYIVAESVPDKDSDVWYVVGPNQVKSSTSGSYTVQRPDEVGGGTKRLVDKQDLLMRAWTPHPNDPRVADSPVRAVLPVLREIERLSMLTFSQIDSRLISAGLMLLPQGVDFPHAEGSNGGIQGLLEMILEVAQAQLTGAGTAAGLIPILAEIPPGTGQDIVFQKFETALQAELKDKLDHAVKRLATGLDISPEEMLGMGKSNHWSANQIDESGVKLFVQPVMLRICDALTEGYLRPALAAAGRDPEKFTIWYDLSRLAVRPNRFEDAVQLFNLGIISQAELRRSGNFSDDDAPDPKELAVWRIWELAKLNPQVILAEKAYTDLLGLPNMTPPPAAALPPGADQAAVEGGDSGQPALTDGSQDPTSAPDTPSGGASPAQQGMAASGVLTAAGAPELLPAAEMVVMRALEIAGGRLLAGRGRAARAGQFADVEKHLLHTRVRADSREQAHQLLEGAFRYVPSLAGHYGLPVDQLSALLEGYCVELLVRGYAHETSLLRETLTRAAHSTWAMQ